jgi:hypothetical protein
VTFGIGVALVAFGLLVGLPASALYHVRLRRALGPQPGSLWWLHPTRHHTELSKGARQRVLRWFGVGVAGFALALIGCALVAIGAFRSG